ncbi:M61 family metallopeptidase [Salinimonas chungwhensis]|uniref:M61 family metallopeptidase n=1 Tax=Salinimonas chungwhensis TaxID=265425 RepID=UPI00036A81B0|nr:PDZ domain-containing protein [Salinimonas chungwhensis]
MTELPQHPHYTLSVASKSQHLFNVELRIPNSESTSITLTLPAWIPGSYMIRDFARNIVSIEAKSSDERILPVRKVDKQTWQVENQGKELTVKYQIFAFDLSVRSAFINDQYAFCNGTSVFLQVRGMETRPHSLEIAPPEDENWLIETTMPVKNKHYQARDYAELIDHPIFIGQALTKSFTVDDVEFVMLFSGNDPLDIERICQDMIPVCQHHLNLFDKPYPVERYVFMTLLSNDGFGGLEHRSSTALLFPRFELPLSGEPATKTDGYTTFLSLCSHELFHTWHVKRIKPASMVSPDMGKEVFTEQLWIYEGFTSFYDDLTLARTGLISPDKYLEIVGQNITRLLQSGGRHMQSAAQSSFDAWTRFYKQDANSINHIVSYYTKGGIIAMGLDLLIREKSQQRYSLDDLMRLLWTHYGKDESGTPDDVIEHLCNNFLNIDVSTYLDEVVHGTNDVPLENWLDDIGIAMVYRPKRGMTDKGGVKGPEHSQNQHFGANIKNASPGVTVAQIMDNTPASAAGLQNNDVIIAADNYVVDDKLLERFVNNKQKGAIMLTVIREGRLLSLNLVPQKAVNDACYFVITDRKKLHQWLGLPV